MLACGQGLLRYQPTVEQDLLPSNRVRSNKAQQWLPAGLCSSCCHTETLLVVTTRGCYRHPSGHTAEHPMMHRTVPETKIIQLKMPIAPRMENPVLEKKGKRINSIHIRPLFESLDEEKGPQQKPVCVCVYKYIWPCCAACIFLPWSGIKSGPSVVKVQSSPNHWNSREFPSLGILKFPQDTPGFHPMYFRDLFVSVPPMLQGQNPGCSWRVHGKRTPNKLENIPNNYKLKTILI